MDSTLIIVMVSIILIGGLLFAVVSLSRRTSGRLDVKKYQTKWLTIQQSLKKDETASHKLAILEADKLVDHALREAGYKGSTMGERMKSAQKVWKNADHVWTAHKIRNKLAHEVDATVTYEHAARSLVAFRQALKDLGAI